MAKPMSRAAVLVLCIVPLSTLLACAPRAIRGGAGTENLGIDEPALSTTLDKADIDYLVDENLKALYQSRFWTQTVSASSPEPIIAIWPIQNNTSEHIGDQLLQLLSSVETSLVNSGEVIVVNRARQRDLSREIGIQHGSTYDPATAQRLGRQLGAQYFLTGKLTAVDERLKKTRRVQYSLFLQVIEIESGRVRFQFESARTKALKG